MPDYPLTEALTKAIYKLFDDPSVAVVLLGISSKDAKFDFKPSLDPKIPVLDRVRAIHKQFEGWIINMSKELDDLGEDEQPRLQAEATALLIVLRELVRHFPEAFTD